MWARAETTESAGVVGVEFNEESTPELLLESFLDRIERTRKINWGKSIPE